MSLHTITESDSFSPNVQMPSDGDNADASDFEASTLKPLVDRTRWSYNRLNPFWAGGNVTTPGTVNWEFPTLGTELKIFGPGLLNLQEILEIRVDRNLQGPLVGPGNGRVPHKLLLKNTSGNINPVTKNYFICAPSANISLTINLGGETLVEGDHFHVLNRSTSYTVTVLDVDGVTPVIVVPAAAIGVPAVQEAIWDGSAWVYGRRIT